MSLAPFDYTALGNNGPIVEGIKDRITKRMRTAAESIFAIGRELNHAKQILKDAFNDWIAAEFEFTERTARNYIAVYKQLGKYEDQMSTIPPSTLYLLAGESVPSEAIETVIARAVSGEHIDKETAAEIISDSRDYTETESEADDEPEAEEEIDVSPVETVSKPATEVNSGPAPVYQEIVRDFERLEMKVDGACQPHPRIERCRGFLTRAVNEYLAWMKEAQP